MIKQIDPKAYWQELNRLNRLISPDEDENRFRADVCNEKVVVVGAFDGDMLIGFGSVSFPYWDRVAMLFHLVVEERFRGGGVGSELIKCLCLTAKDAGIKHISIQTGVWHSQAIKLYKRFGFSARAVFPNYVGEGNDMIWLDKAL